MFFFSGDIEAVPKGASKNAEEAEKTIPTDEFGAKDLRQVLELKSDCKLRPLWVVRKIKCEYVK